MKQGDELYQLQDGDSPYSSSNTDLITALLTLGAQLDATQPFQEFRELGTDNKPHRKVMWLLKAKTSSGVEVKKLVGQWRDPKFVLAHPEHPLAYIKAAIENRHQLISAIKSSVPVSIVRRGKRMAIIPENASPERRAVLLGMLEK